jgi:hypothetical protein
MYPSIKEWTYLAAGVFAVHCLLELAIAQLKLLDAAKISVWVLQGLGAFVSAGVLLPYKLGWGDWWFLLAATEISFILLVTIIVALVFKLGNAGNDQPL